jgi:hypothetical protein
MQTTTGHAHARAGKAKQGLKIVPLEHDEQVSLMRQVKLYQGRWPELKLLYAVPNGGHRSKPVAKRLAAEGVKPGVPDLCLPVARGGFHGLYVEMKRKARSTTTPEQKAWHVALREQGYRVEVCRGADAAMAAIVAYMRLA